MFLTMDSSFASGLLGRGAVWGLATSAADVRPRCHSCTKLCREKVIKLGDLSDFKESQSLYG